MQVSFRNNPTVTAMPQSQAQPQVEPQIPQAEVQTAQVQPQQPEVKGRGFFGTTKEVWKTILKAKETVCAYTSGFLKGLKYAAYAGASLVGIDWIAKSCVNIAKDNKQTSVGHMLATPFVMGWKALRNFTKVVVDFCRPNGLTIPQALKIAVWDAPKKVLSKIYGKHASKNISTVSKIGLPVIALVVGGYTTFRSCLNANERKARIDHRYGGEMGHHHKTEV